MTLMRKKVYVSIQMSDGAALNGYMVIERSARLSDTLNNLQKDFTVLIDEQTDTSHIINKRHIVKVVELPEPDEQLDDDDEDYLELPEEALQLD